MNRVIMPDEKSIIRIRDGQLVRDILNMRREAPREVARMRNAYLLGVMAFIVVTMIRRALLAIPL